MEVLSKKIMLNPAYVTRFNEIMESAKEDQFPFEELISFGKEMGEDLTDKEIRDFFAEKAQEMQNMELSDECLEMVAGGADKYIGTDSGYWAC